MVTNVHTCNVKNCSAYYEHMTHRRASREGWWSLSLGEGALLFLGEIDICPTHVLHIRTQQPSLLLEVLEDAKSAYFKRLAEMEAERAAADAAHTATDRFHGVTAR